MNEEINYMKLDKNNFNLHSLDFFQRYQEVTETWVFKDGALKLKQNKFIDDWSKERRIEKAESILKKIESNYVIYGAFIDNNIIGLIILSLKRFGSNNQYCEIESFHVSNEYRNRGIGKKLFYLIVSEAIKRNIEYLYISAHPSKESQAVYRKFGCTLAQEINEEKAKDEPYDIQMEYKVNNTIDKYIKIS